MSFKNKIIIGFLVCGFFAAILTAGFFFYKQNKNTQNLNTQEEKIEKSVKPDYSILDEITNYQNKYFDIIKRHDVLLSLNNDDEVKEDIEELKKLYEEVENKINKSSKFFIRYKEIEEKFKENNGNTTLEINSFASNHYEEVDKLLNDTYKAVKQTISQDDFNKLKVNQRTWLKEVEAYNSIFEKQGFGTISTLVKLGYETDMRNFRTLLLMFYLNCENNNPKIEDFLGQWVEINAGRIYVEIKKKDDKIEVEYGGANSAYSHSVSKFNCVYDNLNSNLVCHGAKHTNQFVSCNGYSSDDNLEEFLECDEKNPSLTKEDYKVYTDNKKRIIQIKKGTNNYFVIDDEEYTDENTKNEIKKDYENMGLYFDEDKDLVFYKMKK